MLNLLRDDKGPYPKDEDRSEDGDVITKPEAAAFDGGYQEDADYTYCDGDTK